MAPCSWCGFRRCLFTRPSEYNRRVPLLSLPPGARLCRHCLRDDQALDVGYDSHLRPGTPPLPDDFSFSLPALLPTSPLATTGHLGPSPTSCDAPGENGDYVLCTPCDVWLNGSDQWLTHQGGRGHRASVRRQRAALELPLGHDLQDEADSLPVPRPLTIEPTLRERPSIGLVPRPCVEVRVTAGDALRLCAYCRAPSQEPDHLRACAVCWNLGCVGCMPEDLCEGCEGLGAGSRAAVADFWLRCRAKKAGAPRRTRDTRARFRPFSPDSASLSKTLCWCLRHALRSLPHDLGWVRFEDLVSVRKLQDLTPNALAHAVDANPKNRFERRGQGRQMAIRARHGHSRGQVDTDQVADCLTRDQCPDLLAHGTFFAHVESILTSGLVAGGRRGSGNRDDVHMVYAGALSYNDRRPHSIRGIRKSSEVVVVVRPKTLVDQGIQVCLSSTKDVYLAPGVPLCAIVYVMDMKGIGCAPGDSLPLEWQDQLGRRGPIRPVPGLSDLEPGPRANLVPRGTPSTASSSRGPSPPPGGGSAGEGKAFGPPLLPVREPLPRRRWDLRRSPLIVGA